MVELFYCFRKDTCHRCKNEHASSYCQDANGTCLFNYDQTCMYWLLLVSHCLSSEIELYLQIREQVSNWTSLNLKQELSLTLEQQQSNLDEFISKIHLNFPRQIFHCMFCHMDTVTNKYIIVIGGYDALLSCDALLPYNFFLLDIRWKASDILQCHDLFSCAQLCLLTYVICTMLCVIVILLF